MSANASPSLSILVPVYNSGAFLAPCLHSLAAQTAGGVEFLCIDDGSTDGSGAVLDTWAEKDSRFRVIHQPNGGYGKAMNAALAAARGAWVGIVEPDDWVEPTMYSHLMELAAATKAPVVKGSYTIERNGAGTRAGKFAGMQAGTELTPAEAKDYILGALAIWSAIYRRDWLVEHNIRFSETPGASFQDLGFAIRTWVAAPCICITPAAAYHYREDNPDSSSRKLDSGAWAALKEFQSLADVYRALEHKEPAMRHIMVQRIFRTMQADYRLRLSCRVQEFLAAYSTLLNHNFPLQTLNPSAFKKREWHDLQLICNTPQHYPSRRRGNISCLQRIFSCRREAGHRVLRICGFTIHLPR